MLVRGVKGVLLAYVIWCHAKVACISSGYATYLNLDKEVITRATIVCTKSKLKMTQDRLDRAYLSSQCDTFKIDNALVYQDMDAYVYVKQRKSMQDS